MEDEGPFVVTSRICDNEGKLGIILREQNLG